MCGLVAIVAPGRDLPGAVLDRMRDRLVHRGPDGKGSWIHRFEDAVVGFGHRRLAILDRSEAASQPMLSRDGAVALVFNGEIYNYVELREELRREGREFRTSGDTEVLLAAYETWGVDCLSRLDGMFAFVVCDARARRLFVARDRFGEKPLFYGSLPGGGIAIGSEMKALFAHPAIEAVVNDRVLAEYVAGRDIEQGEETLFRGIRRLPPATAMLVAPRGEIVHRWRYWTPDAGTRDPGTDEEAAEHLIAGLRRSVRLRLRADVSVGTSLSGGLDSSTLLGLMSSLRGGTEPARAFSARFDDDPSISEGPYVDRVVRHAGVASFAVRPDPRRLIEESSRLHWHQEEPVLSASVYLQWCVARLAREQGTTVLLDGQGADELLAGYAYYFKAFQLDRLDDHAWSRALRETIVFNRRLRREARAYPDGGRRFDPRIAYGLPTLAAKVLFRAPANGDGDDRVGVPRARPGGRLRRELARNLHHDSLPMLLRYADRNSMAFSREVRLPYLSPSLVEWCLSLPDRFLVRDGWQKYVLRRAAAGVIPDEVRWRVDKVGYAAPLDRWLRGELRAWARERLFHARLRAVPGYSKARLRRLWDAHQRGRADHSWALWRWISLHEWLSLLESGAWSRGQP